MSLVNPYNTFPKHLAQSGVALYLFIIFVAVSGGAAMFGQSVMKPSHYTRVQQGSENMAIAKAALLGYGAIHSRQGSLPCPDADGDGESDRLFPQEKRCQSYRGWLPFRDLGLKDIRDANGERFWYAVDEKVADVVGAGTLTLTTTIKVRVDGTAAAAVLLAPREIIGDQVERGIYNYTGGRSADSDVESYLERHNANNNKLIYTASGADPFNDKLTTLSLAQLLNP